MKALDKFSKIYIYRHGVDMRKQINGLSVLVEHTMQLSPFSDGELFIFSNKKRNRIKMLYWDKTGFALWSKRLEKAKYRWPMHIDGESILLNVQQLEFILAGYDLAKMKPHKNLNFSQTS